LIVRILRMYYVKLKYSVTLCKVCQQFILSCDRNENYDENMNQMRMHLERD
jgi:hypothetical protein